MPAEAATALERVRYTDYLTREDEKAVVDQLPNVMYSSPVMDMPRPHQASAAASSKDTLVLGVSPVPLHPQPHRHRRPLLRRHDDITHQKCAVLARNSP